MVGRSHGIHAEPITFGFKAGRLAAELQRDRSGWRAHGRAIAVGKISGAVGTHAHVSAEVEEFVCERAGAGGATRPRPRW